MAVKAENKQIIFTAERQEIIAW